MKSKIKQADKFILRFSAIPLNLIFEDWKAGLWIRIGSGFNRVCGSGSGYRRAKMTHKSRKKFVKVHVLKCWMASFES
jgi:hypothetical protein